MASSRLALTPSTDASSDSSTVFRGCVFASMVRDGITRKREDPSCSFVVFAIAAVVVRCREAHARHMARQDFEAARRELELARDAVRVAKQHQGGNLNARLYEFTQLVLHSPLISRTLTDLLQSRPTDVDELRRAWQRLHCTPLVDQLVELALLFEKIREAVNNLSHDKDDPLPAHLQENIWGETLQVVMSRLVSRDEAARCSLAQLNQLNGNGFGKIDNWLEYVQKRLVRDGAEIPRLTRETTYQDANRLRALIQRLKQPISDAVEDDSHFGGFVNAYSIHPTIERLRQFDETAAAALRPATSLPLQRLNHNLVLGDVEFIAAQILARLALGPSRWVVLDRLQTYFEHFAYDDLVAKIEDEENHARAGGRDARREEILQDEIDRFIFMEGMYPITHCEVGRGKLDTLIDLYEDADRRRHPPLLIELKQVLNFSSPAEITASAVAAGIRAGRGQAREYQTHVRTNTRWPDVEPIVVVFHNSTARVLAEGDDVVLVNLSNITPSGRRRVRRRTGG